MAARLFHPGIEVSVDVTPEAWKERPFRVREATALAPVLSEFFIGLKAVHIYVDRLTVTVVALQGVGLDSIATAQKRAFDALNAMIAAQDVEEQ